MFTNRLYYRGRCNSQWFIANLDRYQPDGLPNLEGRFWGGMGTDMDGKLFANQYRVNSYDGNGPYGFAYSFNASRYNSIYGNSTHVQPMNVSMLPILKY